MESVGLRVVLSQGIIVVIGKIAKRPYIMDYEGQVSIGNGDYRY